MKRTPTELMVFMYLVLALAAGACGGSGVPDRAAQESTLQVVASTTFIGDVVGEITGGEAELTVLLEPGQNPHAYQPTPRDLALVAEADVFFVNGFQLEGFLDDLIQGSGNAEAVVVVSEGIEPLQVDATDHRDGEENDPDHDPGQLGLDPHVWFDPNNVILWVENISRVLAEEDPEHAGIFRERAEVYRRQLNELDSWIRVQVDQIPPGNRKLVTDHTSFGYFAREYGFELIGAVIPAPTTEAETSGKKLAALLDTIRKEGVDVIFVSADTEPTLAQRVAEDTGAEVVRLYFGSLTAVEPADTYLGFMRYNVETLVQALQDKPGG